MTEVGNKILKFLPVLFWKAVQAIEKIGSGNPNTDFLKRES